MLLPVLIISSLVHIYSIEYMSHDPHNQRFFSYLSLFTFMMILLVTADNYLIMFVGWEGKIYFQIIFLSLLLLFIINRQNHIKYKIINSRINNNINIIATGTFYNTKLNKFNNKKFCRNYSTTRVVQSEPSKLSKKKESHNTRLRLDNAYPDQEEYVRTTRKVLDSIVNMELTIITRNNKKRGKITQSIYFWTLTLPCLNYLHDLFYKNNIKTIPVNIIELLTARGLAFWIMGDGYYTKNMVFICTDSFTLDEINLLLNVLTNKFELSVAKHKWRENVYSICIHKKSQDKLRNLIKPYFISSMLYKLIVIYEKRINNEK